MKIGIIAITARGNELAERLAQEHGDAEVLEGTGVKEKLSNHWSEYDGFICIMALGIVVRSIAPLLKDKRTDPCVVVLDEKGTHIISVLAGHLGGGNELANRIADMIGGRPVITTASDTLGLVALDVWARDQGLAASKNDMTRASGILVNCGQLRLYCELSVNSLPEGLRLVGRPEEADCIISNRIWQGKLAFFPRNLVVGVGCNRGTPQTEFNEALEDLFSDLGFSFMALRNLASIDKKNDEKGLLAFGKQNGWPISFFSKDEINQVSNVETSPAALKAVGAIGVAEPCALLSADSNILLCRKRKWQNITMAVAEVPFTLSVQGQDH